jgi:asparagine synthase (glutamine-hydrolysing)
MYAVISKRADARALGLPQAGAQRAVHPDSGSPAVEVVIEGHLGRAAGAALHRGGDAGALLDLYLAHGPSAIERVDGSFAYVIVDRRDGRVHAGIDKLGQSLAYLAETDSEIVFASTLAELLTLLPFKPGVDMASVWEFLSQGWVISPNSMFEGVSKLQPGSFVTWDGSRLNHVGYYEPLHDGRFVDRPRPVLNREIRQHIHTAVGRGLDWSDSWSSFLSGGLDSSSVVYAMAGAIRQPFPTFYGNFGALDRYMALPDEERVARAVAEKFGTRHSVVTIPADVMDRVPEIVRIIEEPIYDGGPIVVDAVMQAAKAQANGVMTGIGGDFLFGGERRHLLIALLDHTRNLPGWGLAGRLAGLPTSRSAWLTRVRFDVQRTLSVRELSMGEFYVRRLHGAPLVDAFCKPSVFKGLERSPLDKINACLDEVASLDDLTRLLYIDFRLLTPDGLTRDVVALGRDHDLTVCNPYLDSEFVDFSMTMPPREKVRGLTQKYALRQAIRGYLPADVLKKKKGGLGAPIRWWVTHDELVAEHLSRDVVEERGLFEYSEIEQMRADTIAERRDCSLTLWSLFTLECWMRQFADKSFVAEVSRGPVADAASAAADEGRIS